jgi:hypothetical protein
VNFGTYIEEDLLAIESLRKPSEDNIDKMVHALVHACPACDKYRQALINIQNILGFWAFTEDEDFNNITLKSDEAKVIFRILNSILSEYAYDE